MSNNASRFGASTIGIKGTGMAAYTGLLPVILAKREAQLAKARAMDNLFTELDEIMFNAFYASRYASTCINERTLIRQDCLNMENTKVYANARAYRKAALVSTSQAAH
jgi:purine-nucleoside phosphorylase